MGPHCLLQQRDKPCWTVWSLEKSRRRCRDERQGGAVGVPTAPPLIMVSLFALHPDAFMGLMWVKGGVQDISAELERCRGPARTLSLLQVPLQMQEEALGARGHPRDFPLRSQSSSHPPLPAPAQSIHQDPGCSPAPWHSPPSLSSVLGQFWGSQQRSGHRAELVSISSPSAATQRSASWHGRRLTEGRHSSAIGESLLLRTAV